MHIKKLLILVLVLVVLTIRPVPAVRETIIGSDGKSGAMLYFSPDSDPIAHQTTEVNLELQDREILRGRTVSLTVEDSVGGIKETVPVSIEGKTVTGFVVFPMRNIYKFTFTVSDSTAKIIFQTERRILRGVHGADSVKEVPVWARLGLVLSVWFLLVSAYKIVGIVMSQRERQSRKQGLT